jgi:hypothetical protein
MSKLLGWLGGWQGYAAIALACLLAGSLATWRVMSWRQQAQITQAAIRTVKVIEWRDRISDAVATKFEPVRAKIIQDTNKRLSEVETHVTAKSDSVCPVPVGFVRLFNDSTHGPVPGAASGADDAASGVELSDVAKTTVQNNGQYDSVAAQLSALQDWVRQQQAVRP